MPADAASHAHLLRSLASLADLRGFVAALGHDAAWQPLPADPRLITRGAPAAIVGRAGPVRWLGLLGPATLARAVARRARDRGQPCGVLALDLAARTLGVSVAWGEAPLRAVPLDAPGATALELLRRLGHAPGASPVAELARQAEALATRAVDREFFRRFRRVLDAHMAALPLPTAAERHALALLQLTRVLFLHFVQQRGWLDGRDDFLARAVDGCLAARRSVQRDLLRPLFFGALSRPPDRRSPRVRRLGELPYLNGGLFEPHPLERRWRLDLPDALWRDAFDELFGRFHFAAGGGEGTVGPAMLGRVFESVMDPSERRASGTYYTPPRLARRLVHTGLVTLAARRLGVPAAEVEARWAARDPALRAVLERVRVLDPACGSGAFLLEALEELAPWRGGRAVPRHVARRRVIAEQLFGVDRNGAAVHLAQLRLWLAVLADDPAAGPREVQPLPNLDAQVRQGDSLHDPLRDADAAAVDAGRRARLRVLRQELVTAAPGRKRALLVALRREERGAAIAICRALESRREHAIRGRLAAWRGPTLFPTRPAPAAAAVAALRAERQALRALRAERRRLEREDGVPWFHYASHFPDVCAAGGFDLVAGNPPWVRAEALDPAERARLAARYRWWRPAPGTRNAPDLAVAFVERALELATPGGVVALLLPAKLASTQAAERARRCLATETTIHVLAADAMPRAGERFEAAAYPMAVVLEKARPAPAHAVRLALDDAPATVAQRAWELPGPWVIARAPVADLLATLARRHPPLREMATPRLGVKTGLDAAFLSVPPDADGRFVRPAIGGRDLVDGGWRRTRPMLWPLDAAGRPLADLPAALLCHFARHDRALRRRADYAGGPPWTLFRTEAARPGPRLAWADLTRSLHVALLDGPDDPVPLNTCYVAAMPSRCAARRVLAWLRAPALSALARLLAPPAMNGYARFNAAVVGALPLPPAVLADDALDGGAPVPLDLVADHLHLEAGERRTLEALLG